MDVQSELGSGFLEHVYHVALALEFEARQIPFEKEVQLPVWYKGHRLEVEYRADFVCFSSVIVELKALPRVGGVEEAQTINDLKATAYEVGLLLNFGEPSLGYRRFALSQSASSAKSADSRLRRK